MYNLTKKLIIVLMLISFFSSAYSDDIDIINNELPIDSNVLFIMDLSGSMNYGLDIEDYPLAGDPTRLEVLQGAFHDIISDTDLDDINIGLSVFSGAAQGNRGSSVAHGITYPTASLSSATEKAQNILSKPGFVHPGSAPGISYMPNTGTRDTRAYLQLMSADAAIWSANGSTPVVDALHEAALYFRGEEVKWGKYPPNDIRAAHPSTYSGLISNTVTTITPACTLSDRFSCTKATCGTDMQCTTGTKRETRSNEVNGTNCTTNTGNEERCSSGATSCGLGTNCVSRTAWASTVICESIYSTAAGCEAAHASDNWHSCSETEVPNCSTDAEGTTTCGTPTKVIKCKQDIKRYYCDANDTYTCDFSGVESCTQCPDPFNTTSISGSATYKSPITGECPVNGIILLTDGRPSPNINVINGGPDNVDDVLDMIDAGATQYSNGCDAKVDANGFPDAGRCGPELAEFLSSTDHNTSTDGFQNVKVFTVGLALDAGTAAESAAAKAYLKAIANKGGGSSVTANNRADLAATFKQYILAIAKRARSFSAPTYTINKATGLTHDKYVYVPVFDRGSGPVWSGNLKKYELKNGALYGKAGLKATGPTGQLIDTVEDFWSTEPSNSAITSGGAANKIPSLRKAYTDNGSSIINLSSAPYTKFNAANNVEKDKLVNYILGKEDDGTTARNHMGDIIHSKPLQLAISQTESILFVGSNEGYLHAIKSSTGASDGTEIFAYMPSELLKNIKPQYESESSLGHMYGVDASATLWHDDTNHNGIKEASETAYIYFGLRRGGKAYYALDVTTPSSPKLVWKITNTGSFSNLGFTWSQPALTKLKYKVGTIEKTEPVLVFGGGYVDDHNGEAENSGTGANVYIVNAKTGNLILKVADAGMYAVPGEVRVVDIDRNGSVDRLYFGDTGANIWRVDLSPDSNNPYDMSNARLTKFAYLGGSAADNRKFFVEPDVAIFKHKGRFALSISIGSGERPDPLNSSVDDHFFMLLDENVFNVTPLSHPTITINQLKSAPLSATDPDLVLNLKTGKKGWKMNLNPAASITGLAGEKVLSTALTYDNKVLFNTFGVKSITTNTSNGAICGIDNKNTSRLYILDLLTGGAALNLDKDTANTINDDSDSSIEITNGEIPGRPEVIYPSFNSDGGGACTTDDCYRSEDFHAGYAPSAATNKTDKLQRVYWLDTEK